MKPINYSQIIEKAEARRAALESITPKLQAVHSQWHTLARHISVVNHEYKQLDSEAAEILAQAVGVSKLTLTNKTDWLLVTFICAAFIYLLWSAI